MNERISVPANNIYFYSYRYFNASTIFTAYIQHIKTIKLYRGRVMTAV